MASFSKKLSIFNLRRDHQKKISYERRDYESVDEKEPILGYVPEKTDGKKEIQEVKGLNEKGNKK